MRHTGVNRCRTVIALAGVALLAACSAPAASPLGGPVPTAGVVIGNLMGHGGPPPGINAPLCGVVTVTRADGGQVVGTARVGAGGSFMVSLAPGVHRFAADLVHFDPAHGIRSCLPAPPGYGPSLSAVRAASSPALRPVGCPYGESGPVHGLSDQ